MNESLSERIDILLDIGMPPEWAESYARLYHAKKPAAFTDPQWRRLVIDAAMFWDSWGARAVALHWSPDDVRNLFALMRGRQVVAIDHGEVTLSDSEVAYKRPVIGGSPKWQEGRRAA